MRTKALLGAAILAAGLATSMAQNVYSLNVVGYYNVTVPAGKFAMIANQLNSTNMTLSALIPNPPPNSTVFKYTTGAGYQDVYTFDEFDLVWKPNGNLEMKPGEGYFFQNGDTANPYTITLVGEVPQGPLTNAIPAGYSIKSSIVPQGGDLTTMGLVGDPNDTIYRYTPGQGYTPAGVYTFDEFDLVWKPSNPQVNVGEAFFFSGGAAKSWVRNFTVPQ
jgi:hypothetical protein